MVGLWRHDCTVSRPSWALSPSLRMLQPVCILSGQAEFLSVQDSTQAELYRIHMNAVQLSVCVIDSWIPLAFDRFSLDIIIHIDCTSVGPSWISAHLLSKPVSSTHQSLLYNNQPSHESTDQQLIISSKVKCFLFSTKTRLYWTYHCSHHQMVTGSHWIIAICLNFIIISEIWAVLLGFNFSYLKTLQTSAYLIMWIYKTKARYLKKLFKQKHGHQRMPKQFFTAIAKRLNAERKSSSDIVYTSRYWSTINIERLPDWSRKSTKNIAHLPPQAGPHYFEVYKLLKFFPAPTWVFYAFDIDIG